jgi:hypothetical protein
MNSTPRAANSGKSADPLYVCPWWMPNFNTRGATDRWKSSMYLMSRLSLQVFYLWRHVLSTAPPFILWWSNLKMLFAHLHRRSPFIGGLCCQAIQTEHAPYIAERTQKAVYIVRCLCYIYSKDDARSSFVKPPWYWSSTVVYMYSLNCYLAKEAFK